jgi:hypothetical protein
MEKVNPKFKNPELYMKAKKEIMFKYKKHSAYRSMMIVKKYKELGGKVDESKKVKGGTNRWLQEKWKNLTPVALGLTKIANAPPCGVKHPKQGKNKSICRPTKRINNKTPKKLAESYNIEQIKKAQKLKNLGVRIKWSEL